MQQLIWNQLDKKDKSKALERPTAISDPTITNTVRDILQAVLEEGDAALSRFTSKFDGVTPTQLKVPETELQAAWQTLPALDQAALRQAKTNIEKFHKVQYPEPIVQKIMPGLVCRREARAIDSVGLYVPGGSAPLVSTVLMLAIPAKIAGVARRVLVTPPTKTDGIDLRILAAAYLCGITEVFQVGGAQAIAALAYGTTSVPKVAKIFGPGNAWVAAAKSLVSAVAGGPAIDLPAGPSEVLVLADSQADPSFVAADLLSQAEHDPLSQVICVCDSERFADQLQIEITAQLATLPRQKIAAAALQNGRILITEDRNQMIEIANSYAPEHLIVQLENPSQIVPDIRNAGSIFLGPWTPESVGDYASGTNHTLPTFGAARAYSGVCVESFMKYVSIQELTRDGLAALGPVVQRLATMEGLEAHKRAISVRLAPETIS
ncbi:MAG: histidinol dehydrogenase [Robiginitomaculum sp.]|nr:MAG: histidinol dehydrogenase [Robiginitomaculum sp.]